MGMQNLFELSFCHFSFCLLYLLRQQGLCSLAKRIFPRMVVFLWKTISVYLSLFFKSSPMSDWTTLYNQRCWGTAINADGVIFYGHYSVTLSSGRKFSIFHFTVPAVHSTETEYFLSFSWMSVVADSKQTLNHRLHLSALSVIHVSGVALTDCLNKLSWWVS